MKVVVTGAAGFIGFHVCQALLDRGDHIIGVDNLNAYYDPALKRARIAEVANQEGFHREGGSPVATQMAMALEVCF